MNLFPLRRRVLPLLAAVVVTTVFSSPAIAQTKAIVMPVDLEIYLLTAGGSREFQPEWTETGQANVQTAFDEATSSMFDSVALPELSAEEQVVLDEHLALFDVAVSNSITMINTAKMKHKIDNYDYTLGPGLAWLADKSGAEKMVMYVAEQEKSSGGRIAMMVLGAAVGGATGVYVVPGIGSSYNVTGVIDLRSGNIEWANYRTPVKGDMRKATSATKSVDDLFDAFPKGRLMQTTREY